MDDAIFIELQQLFRLVNERGLRELSVSRPGFSVSMTSVQSGTAVAAPAPILPATPVEVLLPPVEQVVAAPEGYTIASPLVGIFYRAASPDSPVFVEIGDTVEVGQTIGIVEAMKVFNEITADRAGTVIAIPTANGTLVQADQPLVILDVLE